MAEKEDVAEPSDINVKEIAEYHRQVKKELGDDIPLGISMETLKMNYPALYKDMVEGRKIALTVEEDEEEEEEPTKDMFRGYIPNVYDYLARANTVEQCLEIIDYLEKKGEIETDLADKLREQAQTQGADSFGTRAHGYYDSMARRKTLS